jgi:hypothetical protein
MAVTPDPESLNSNKKGAKLPLLAAEDCHTQIDGQHSPLITIKVFFSRVKKPSDDINSHLFLMNKKGIIVASSKTETRYHTKKTEVS